MTSDELGPKTKVDEVETAEPLEATPASPEDGIRVKRVPTKVTYWRVVLNNAIEGSFRVRSGPYRTQ